MQPLKSTPAPAIFPIVGIGASAGGLAAFIELLGAIPKDSGMAFVIVQHLDPAHSSALSEVLAKATPMTVATAIDGIDIAPDRVYVVPPNVSVALKDNALSLVEADTSHSRYLSIDFFFRSLAAERRERAIGVVLSGTGSDGTEGLRAIRAEGGIAFAQSPQTARFPEMPASALAAAVVDHGMAIPELARELVRLSRHPYLAADASAPSPDDAGKLESVLAAVRDKTGVDYSEYKPATIERRLARRMALRHQDTIEGYLRLLSSENDEARALCEDVLIHVTSFFRDPAAFQALAEVALPQILEAKAKETPLRAWVAGCSTGEEVYSLAITLLEAAPLKAKPRPIQIFGSDLSERAIEKARAGVYSDAAVAEMPEELRHRYFVKVEQGWRISKLVRDLCLFVRHDLARNPPFARLDILCCRNVLIYFGPALQQRVMSTFHYCLNRPGFLVLGRSESIGGFGHFFATVDRSNKIFVRTAARSTLNFSAGDTSYRALGLVGTRAGAPPAPDLVKHVDGVLLARYSPPGVVVNERLEVVQFRGRTGPFLEAAPGQPQTNVLKMARQGLLLPLQTALAKARKEKVPVQKRGVEVGGRGDSVICDLVVIPMTGWPGAKEPLYLIAFEENAHADEAPRSKGIRKRAAGSEVKRLERELFASKEYLQSLLEEHGRVNDDLGTANEELISGNEELQSMNEEMQTAKEELQSANEELTTVNDELQSGNRELNLANGDLVNLLNTVEIPIVFLDAERKIRRFTPQAQSVFNLLGTDIGRPIDNVKPKVKVPDLDGDIAWSIANVTVRESQVQDTSGRWYRMQIRPYQTSDGKVDGAILSLVDIDVLKRHVEQAEWARDYAVSVVDAVLAPLVVLDEDLEVISANAAFYESFGGSKADTEGRSLFALSGRAWDIESLRAALRKLFEQREAFQGIEVARDYPRAGRRTMSFSARSVHFRNSRPMTLLSIEDVTTRIQVDAERKKLLAEAQHARAAAEQANRTKDAFLATLSHELRTPLATMLMNAQLMRHADLEPEKLRRATDAIERSAKAQSQLIEDLLDVSRIVTGKLSLDLRRASLLDVVAQALEGVALQAERKRIRISSELDPATFSVLGDSLRLLQVTSNLLVNAVKFTPEDGAIQLRLGNEGEKVFLRVSDTGSGIEPQFLPFVFDRFTQQENSSVRRFGGLGLGLSIVRHIVELHGGTVKAESPGKGMGATFSVALPRLRGPQGEVHRELAPVAAPQPPAVSRLQGLRILVVDDDLETLEALGEMLRHNGASVISARSAAEALQAAQKDRPQVIVSDISMPDADGYTLIRNIRALPAPEQAGVPAIALTAGAGPAGRERSLDAGFQDHLEKPVDIEKLARALVEAAHPSAPRSTGRG